MIAAASGLQRKHPETLNRVYGHHSPDYLKGAATAIAGKDTADVSVVESVVGKARAPAKGQNIK